MKKLIALLVVLCGLGSFAKDHTSEYKVGALLSWTRDSVVQKEHVLFDYKVRRPIYKVVLGDSIYQLQPLVDIFPHISDPLQFLTDDKHFNYRLDPKHPQTSVKVEAITHHGKKEFHDEGEYEVMGVEPLPAAAKN